MSLGYRIVRLSEKLSGFSIFCYQCLTLMEWHFVPSTCPLDPRDEMANHRCGIRDGIDLVAELWLVRTTPVAWCP